MENNWIYYGVFFSEKTKKAIFKYVKTFLNEHGYDIPSDWKIYCDHMTLVFNDRSEEKQKIAESIDMFIGKYANLRSISVGISDRAIALGIDFTTQNNHSHVTVAIAPDAKPVESNNITKWIPTNGDFYITGKYDKILRK